MEKKVTTNTRLAVAAVAVLLFGLLLAGQEAAAAGYASDTEAAPTTEKAAPATDAAPPTEAAAGYGPATKAAPAPATDAATATAPAADAAEATPTTAASDGGKASYGKASKGDCEVPGTCDVKAVDPTRPGAFANPYTRGCNPLLGCRG